MATVPVPFSANDGSAWVVTVGAVLGVAVAWFDATPSPAPLTARTSKVYAVPSVSPVTV